MSTSTSPHAVRCPRCSAHVRTGSDWCTLCYADLRAAPPAAEPVEVVEPVEAARVPSVGGGKHAKKAAANAVGTGVEVELLAEQMLAELAVSESKNPLGPLASHLDTPGKRVGVMIGGAVTGICLLFIVMTILGAVFS